ncbi:MULTISPECIES: hypothetical protein [Lysobacter]|uniref:hypothetical protein n=1 Tax=Lysobacter TaxID=68 RepID=UPI001F448DB3|nr:MULTISPECIES: hypothetical protein [Lysobacter]UJB18006.1 hypothetical protein L1A79_16800 [Lysobacter capsici]UJQ28271.1 hypothetical protein L2D09_23085 [Lysobacter gummosus]
MNIALQLKLSGILLAGAICLGSCGNDPNKIYVQAQFETLARDGRLLDEKHIAVAACIRAHPHGMELTDCSAKDAGIPLESSDTSTRSGHARFYEMALRSQVESKPPPKVYICGAFHLASRGNGRWIVVESMSGNGFPAECRIHGRTTH